MNKKQIKDAERCERLAEQGKYADCLSCACRVCIAQEPKSLKEKENEESIKVKLEEIKEYLEQREGWSLEELIEEIAHSTKLLKFKQGLGELSIDECEIGWGEDYICDLSEFIESYTNEFIKKVCNVIDSFILEEENEKR